MTQVHFGEKSRVNRCDDEQAFYQTENTAGIFNLKNMYKFSFIVMKLSWDPRSQKVSWVR